MKIPAWQTLIAAIPPYQRKLERRVLLNFAEEFADWCIQHQQLAKMPKLATSSLAVCDFLADTISADFRRIEETRRGHGEFLGRFTRAITQQERHDLLLKQAATAFTEKRPSHATRRNPIKNVWQRISSSYSRASNLSHHDSRAQTGSDKAALQRWFGPDALDDRMHAHIARLERRIAVALSLFGQQTRTLLQETGIEDWEPLWQRLKVEATARDLFTFEGHPRVKLAAFNGLAEAIKGLPPTRRNNALAASSIQFIYRCCLDARQYPWLQIEAIELLWAVAPDSFLDVARLRLKRQDGGDDLFVRRRTLEQAAAAIATHAAAAELLPQALEDDSPFVRQGLALALSLAPAAQVNQCLPRLLVDAVPQVRAQALLALGELCGMAQKPSTGSTGTTGTTGTTDGVGQNSLLTWLAAQLESETDSFVLRSALFVTETILSALPYVIPGKSVMVDIGQLIARIHQAISALHANAADLKVRRWAAHTLSHFSLWAEEELLPLVEELGKVVSQCAPGQQRVLPRQFNQIPAERLARAGLFLAQADYSLDFERRFGRWHVHRGHRFGFRLWRWLHEFRHPSPDKRQAFRHTIGRHFAGNLRVPSPILAELAATKVPGEPLHLSSEAGWRPYLPLADELISCLDLSPGKYPIRIFSAEGVTELSAPKSLLRRLWMRTKLCWRFADFAQARNWHDALQQPADNYAQLLHDTGFTLRFVPHANTNTDPAVQRFFRAALPVGLPGLSGMPGLSGLSGLPSISGGELWERFENYFFSVYGNTVFELTLLISTALAGFVARHILANRSIRRYRDDIPLVMGGWGTRGKSGTERLKAGLFNSLGYSVVSKTTGCEAMFLHSHPYQPLREMFLFRPYDKATIWEQHDVTRIASALKADVLLWECMALTPAFVELLQKRWMRDDLSTITNTFPDHEDLQGPAGINIPQVMTHFIPKNSVLLTSEEQMRPILATAAAALGTRIDGVGWLESGLLTPDILSRFPYQEHPDNIALVVRMAAELGISADYALKEMADKVVADLGVLKVYPQASIDGRRLSFVNGMSANERFGCLGNWYRLGFDKIDVEAEPATLICTVVNNRADRIARSRVFASILVSDISADRHFLIGSNLEGLLGYVREAWDAHVAEISLWPENGTAPQAVFEHHARRLRAPYTAARQRARLAAMLTPAGLEGDSALLELYADPVALGAALAQRQLAHAEQITACVARDCEVRREYDEFVAQLMQVTSGPVKKLDEAFRAIMWRWFESKLIPVMDYYTSGNKIIRLIADHTPPGFHSRIMGMQNIKGTGLDFVYRWQAWALCHEACTELRTSDATTYRRGLAALSRFQEYGVLSEEHVRETLVVARTSVYGQTALGQSQLTQIGANLVQAMVAVNAGLGAAKSESKLESLVLTLEGFVDAGDAVRRRRVANQIYKDLIAARISHSRAAIELLKLTQQQKGGWLYDKLRIRMMMLVDSVQVFRRKLKDAKFRLR